MSLTNKPLYVLETKHSSDSRAQIVEGKDAPRSCHEGSSWWQGGAWLRVLLWTAWQRFHKLGTLGKRHCGAGMPLFERLCPNIVTIYIHI